MKTGTFAKHSHSTNLEVTFSEDFSPVFLKKKKKSMYDSSRISTLWKEVKFRQITKC